MRAFFIITVLCGILQISSNVYADSNSIIGQWEEISSSPSQEELMNLVPRPKGIPANVQPEIVETKTKFIITEKSITTESTGLMSVNSEMPYSLEGNKIKFLFSSEDLEHVPDYQKQFITSYYIFRFEGDNLILTTNEIPGYGNRTITTVLKRIQS